jgi:hypothetical protein
MFIVWNVGKARPARGGKSFPRVVADAIADALEMQFGFHYVLVPANG